MGVTSFTIGMIKPSFLHIHLLIFASNQFFFFSLLSSLYIRFVCAFRYHSFEGLCSSPDFFSDKMGTRMCRLAWLRSCK